MEVFSDKVLIMLQAVVVPFKAKVVSAAAVEIAAVVTFGATVDIIAVVTFGAAVDIIAVVTFGAAVLVATKKAGIASRSNMDTPHVFMARSKHKMPMIFIGSPARACNIKRISCL